MDDIKTVLTDSLSRTGDGGMLVAMEFASGLVGAPGITWTSEPTSGFYLAAANDMRVSIAGSDRARFRADASNPFQIWAGGAWSDPLNEGSAYTITAAWTFTGGVTFTTNPIVAGTVAADFGAVTATSYGGITEGNLVDKSAAETIAGSWTFTGDIVAGTADADFDALTATSFGGILQANLVGKNVAETISGAWTFTGIPILDAPVAVDDFGTGGRVKDGIDQPRPVGFNVMPVYERDGADTLDLNHNGMMYHNDGAATFAHNCPSETAIPQGATYVMVNEGSAGVMTITATGTLRWFDGSTTGGQTGTRTLALGGVCTVYKYSDSEWFIWGNGLT